MAEERADERMTMPMEPVGEILLRNLEIGLGAMVMTAESAQRLVADLVRRGQVARDESGKVVERVLAYGREQRDALAEMIDAATERALRRMDVARRGDIELLRGRVAALEIAMRGEQVAIEPVSSPGEEQR